MRLAVRFVRVLALVLLPTLAFAQGTLTGTVRDASGGVLPGVTVEAASPALIEKVRTVVTDGSGQYRIIELPPGTYALTFTLPGFSDRQARRHRAVGHGGLDDPDGDARRRAGGDDHGHR